MFSRSALLAALSLALAVASNPIIQIRDVPVTLPMVKRMNLTGTINLLERDQKRVQGLRARANAKLNGQSSFVEDAAASVTATNQLVDYVVNVSDDLCFYGIELPLIETLLHRLVWVRLLPHVRSSLQTFTLIVSDV